jgi:hypothetical protein
MALRPSTMSLRRRSNARRICSTLSCGPVSAARAASCEMFDTLLDRWDCRFAAPAIASAGPTIQPSRQPVIA